MGGAYGEWTYRASPGSSRASASTPLPLANRGPGGFWRPLKAANLKRLEAPFSGSQLNETREGDDLEVGIEGVALTLTGSNLGGRL